MKTYFLLLLLMLSLATVEASAQSRKKRKPVKKTAPKPVVAPAPEERLIGKISTGKLTIKVHRVTEVFLSPCEKCIGTNQNYKPKPNHRVLLFEISRRNPNNYELSDKFDNTTPLYARIVGSNGVEYPCYTVPSLVELAMEQKKILKNKHYFDFFGPAPSRTEHRAFALAVEMPLDVQPQELVWNKAMRLKCALNMLNNLVVTPAPVIAEKTVSEPKTASPNRR